MGAVAVGAIIYIGTAEDPFRTGTAAFSRDHRRQGNGTLYLGQRQWSGSLYHQLWRTVGIAGDAQLERSYGGCGVGV